jgi:hypothetical protein
VIVRRFVVLLLAACGPTAAAAPTHRPTHTAAPTKTRPAVKHVEPRIAGTWTTEVVTGKPFIAKGAVRTPNGVAIYAGDIGGGQIYVVRDEGPSWKLQELNREPLIAVGHIASRDARLATTALRLDMSDGIKIDVLLLTPKPETVLKDCGLGDNHAVVIDSKRIVVVADCRDRMFVVEGNGGAWAERMSWTSPKTRFENAAVDADDRLHLQLITAGVPHHIVIDGKTRNEAAVPPKLGQWDLRACDGQIYGTFENRDDGWIAFGTFRDQRWTLEEIERGTVGVARIGFDEECRPFVSLGEEVWSRGAKGWVRSALAPDQHIRALIGRNGKLHAAYEQGTVSVVGIATAPLIAEP